MALPKIGMSLTLATRLRVLFNTLKVWLQLGPAFFTVLAASSVY